MSCNFFTGPDVTWTKPTTMVALGILAALNGHVEVEFLGPDVTTKPTTMVEILAALNGHVEVVNFFTGPDVI